jgi:flagellar protein FliS
MNAIARYEEQAITTQNRGRLVVLLYEGAIRFLRQALAASMAREYRIQSQSISRAQDILMELNTVLDMEAGGALAQNLRALYTFLWQHLYRSNMNNHLRGIRQSIAILEELVGGWKVITAT